MNTAFQTPLPTAVNTMKRPIGCRARPAGTETTLRTTGTKRPSSTIQPPQRSKSRRPRSRSETLTRTNQRFDASRCSRSYPSPAPTA